MTEKTLDFDIAVVATVRHLKEMIERRESIPLAQQKLIFGGGQLENDVPLSTYGTRDGDTMFLVLVLSRSTNAQVIVQEFSGRKTSFRIGPSDSVLGLKDKIQETLGFPVVRQRLFLDGNDLANRQLLSFYGIGDSAVLYLITRSQ